jgi:hypothetical protein
MSESNTFLIALLIKPFIMLFLFAFLLWIRRKIIIMFPEGKIKRLLLIRLDKGR